MFYYKNIEISKQYGVSATTVTAWIENALASKNNLTVEMVEGKFRVLVNSSNDLELKRLAEDGKKYKNVDSVKKYEVGNDFYEIFTPLEILEIIRNLEYRNLLNLKYSYAERGAKLWDDSYHAGSSPIHKCVGEFTTHINQVITDEL